FFTHPPLTALYTLSLHDALPICTVVAALMEGTRPLLVEVQALVGPAPFGGTPRRQVAGIDYQRAAIVLAVLERRCGFSLHAADVDRKSTRLNSSHVKISYAVFCL